MAWTREKKREWDRERRKERYANDPNYRARSKQINKSWSERRRQELRQYKLDTGCLYCGYNRCAESLCFHHRDGDSKELTLGEAVRYSKKRIWIEVAKCDVVCSNCHGELHAGILNVSGQN